MTKTYPNLPGRQARRRMRADRAADAALAEVFDQREADRLTAFTPDRLTSLAKAQLKKVLRTREEQRVAAIIERDKADRAADKAREAARIELASGKRAFVVETHIPPTPEWLRQADHESFTPRQHDKTTVQIRTVRRVQSPQARKMLLAGVIDHQGYIACQWYEGLYETAGFAGNVPSVDLDREAFAMPSTRAAFTEAQLEAQDALKFIRKQIEARHLRLLDAMVLQNIPIKRAVRQARAFHREASKAFGRAVDQLVAAREAYNVG